MICLTLFLEFIKINNSTITKEKALLRWATQ